MSVTLTNIFIGSDTVADKASGLAIRRIYYVINGSSVMIENPYKDIIYIDIKSDDDIIKEKENISQIFHKLDAKHKLILHSESIEKSRILLCKILLRVCKIKLININDILLIRKKQSQTLQDNEDTYYEKLNNEELEILKVYEKIVFGETSLVTISENTMNDISDDKIARNLYEEELMLLEQHMNTDPHIDKNSHDYVRSPISPQTIRLTDPIYPTSKNDKNNDSNYRNADYRKIMNIFSGRVNPDLVREMLQMNMSVVDVIDSLSVK